MTILVIPAQAPVLALAILVVLAVFAMASPTYSDPDFLPKTIPHVIDEDSNDEDMNLDEDNYEENNDNDKDNDNNEDVGTNNDIDSNDNDDNTVVVPTINHGSLEEIDEKLYLDFKNSWPPN